jgi:hypothetical protein
MVIPVDVDGGPSTSSGGHLDSGMEFPGNFIDAEGAWLSEITRSLLRRRVGELVASVRGQASGLDGDLVGIGNDLDMSAELSCMANALPEARC